MDTEFFAALDDDVDASMDERLITTQPFSPPSLSSSQLKQLELLQHLSSYSELLILVCADKGMGKTFIAKALLASREVPDQSLMLEAYFSLSYLDALHKLAQFLDLAELADDVDSIEQQILVQCLQISAEEQGSVLLIIDQADQLSDDVLEDINQLALLAPSALHIMLLAPTIFENKLLTLTEPQAPFHVMAVESFIDDEAEILLLEQFPDKDWSAEQVDYIVQQSVGNPGKILYLAQQIVAGVKPQQKNVEATKFPITHIAAMLMVASVLVVAYFYQNNSTVLESDNIIVEASTPFAAESIPVESSLAIAEGVPFVATVEEASLIDTAATKEVDFNFTAPVAADLLQEQSRVLSEPRSNELVQSGPVLKETVINEAVTKEHEIVYSKNEQVLIAAASSEFVIQLFGSHSSDNALAFIGDNATKAIQLRSYQTEHKGKPWHVVIAGPFKSRALANEQSKALTTTLRKQNPWVRSISPIQAQLKARI
ncbi:MAG: AAA family ATPase [Oleispira sp.]